MLFLIDLLLLPWQAARSAALWEPAVMRRYSANEVGLESSSRAGSSDLTQRPRENLDDSQAAAAVQGSKISCRPTQHLRIHVEEGLPASNSGRHLPASLVRTRPHRAEPKALLQIEETDGAT